VAPLADECQLLAVPGKHGHRTGVLDDLARRPPSVIEGNLVDANAEQVPDEGATGLQRPLRHRSGGSPAPGKTIVPEGPSHTCLLECGAAEPGWSGEVP